MSYRRRRAPVSTLRARLQERLSERDFSEEGDLLIPDDEPAARKPFFLLGALQTMFRYFPLKLTIAVALIFVVALVSKSGYGWGAPLLRGLRFVVEWDLDPGILVEQAEPAYRNLVGERALPAFRPEGQLTGGGVLPFAGELRSGFGLRDDSESGIAVMHYGIDLAAPQGTAVKAILKGRVDQVLTGSDNLVTVVIVPAPRWTMLYRGLAETAVEEGENVERGALLGSLGPAWGHDQSHLHLELRCDGQPVAPPASWTASFDTAAERT